MMAPLLTFPAGSSSLIIVHNSLRPPDSRTGALAATPSPLSAVTPPGHACLVLSASDIYGTSGANQGDGLQGPQEADLSDVCQLDRDAVPLRLVVRQPKGAGSGMQGCAGLGPLRRW